MDISLSSIAPRVVADLRPAADAAATGRIDRPPAALALASGVAPAALSQEGLVARGFMEPAGPSPVAATSESSLEVGQGPKRVLKPWGVPMLPYEDPNDDASREARHRGSGPDPGPAEEAEQQRPDPMADGASQE